MQNIPETSRASVVISEKRIWRPAFLTKPDVLRLEQFNFEMQPIASNVTSALLVKLPAFGCSQNERRRLRALRDSTFSKLNWSGSEYNYPLEPVWFIAMC